MQLQHQPVLLSGHRKGIDPRAGDGKVTGDAESARSWEKLSETAGTTGTAWTEAASTGIPKAPHSTTLSRTRSQHGLVQHGAALPPPGPQPSSSQYTAQIPSHTTQYRS